MGVGAWYSQLKLGDSEGMEFNRLYQETMDSFVAPAIRELVKRGTLVYFVGLPPAKGKYDWDTFAIRDKIAKLAVEPAGAVFLDISRVLEERKRNDPYLTADGLHWW